jgi:N-acetylglucosaminyl-diphospho-decaprenol L-rhamnosyltransferase
MSEHYLLVATEHPSQSPRGNVSRSEEVVISICIVNTDGREDLLACLESIFRHPPRVKFEVTVIDNASEDGSAAAARTAFGDRIEILALERRRGKPENDTELMRRARGPYCLLLNEDSELTEGAVEELHNALERIPGAAAAGARLVDSSGAERASAWRFPGLRSALVGALFLHGRLTVQSRDGGEPREVDWVQSAGMLVRKRAFDEVGPLDPVFFVYSDEVDWQKRAHDAGWSILYVPRATVVHHEQLSGGAAATRRIIEFCRNRDAYVRKHDGAAAALAVRVLSAWAYAVRALTALVMPSHSAGRYARHAYHSLFPRRGRGLREAAEEFNRRRDTS